MNYRELYELWKREKDNNELQKLPVGFYLTLSEYISSLKEKCEKSKGSIEGKILTSMYERACKLAVKLVQLRYNKILKALVDEEISLDSLAEEESMIYDSLRNIRKCYKKLLSQARGEYELGEGQAIVRFIKPYPAIEGPFAKRYGPFLSGDLAILPVETVRSLLREGVIRVIHARL